jgi:hypothetical protein
MKIRTHEHGACRFSQTVFMDAESSDPLGVILTNVRIHEHGVCQFSQTVFMDAESSSA